MTHVECPFCKGVVGVERAGAFRCPSCGGTFAVELPDEPAPSEPEPAPAPPPAPALPNAPPCARHATSPATAICGRCGNFVCAACATSRAQGVFCPECADKVAAPGALVPWEDPRVGGGVGLVATVRLAFKNGWDLMARVPCGTGYARPYFYALLLSIPCGLIGEVMQILISTAAQQPLRRDDIVGALIGVAVAPIVLPLVVAYQHLCVRVAGGAGTFETTWRIVCYGASPAPLNVIPYVGPVASGIMGLILNYRGYVVAHRLSKGRALLALLVLPAVFACAIGIAVAVCIGVVVAILK